MALNDNPTLVEIVDEVERLNNLIVNRGGSQTITPKTSNQVINKGYYKGDITVKGDANLIAPNIISGKSIFGVSGSATVSSLGGRKWASGTTTNFLHGSKSYHIQVNGLFFKPKTIILTPSTTPGGSGMYSNGFLVESNNSIIRFGTSNYVVNELNATSPTISTGSSGEYPYYGYYVYNDGFFFKAGSSITTYKWIAYE